MQILLILRLRGEGLAQGSAHCLLLWSSVVVSPLPQTLPSRSWEALAKCSQQETRVKCLGSKSDGLQVEMSLGQALRGCHSPWGQSVWEKAESGSPPSTWRQTPSSLWGGGDSEPCQSDWRLENEWKNLPFPHFFTFKYVCLEIQMPMGNAPV